MTDTMLFGVLKMPFEMAMKDEISRIQYYARVQELVGRFEAQQQAEPTCPDCKAAVLYECVACSSNNYPPKQQAEPVADEAIHAAWSAGYVEGEKAALQQQAEPPPEWLLIKNILDEYGLQAIDFVAEFKAAQQQAEPVGMPMPRVGDRVICLEDESLGTVVSLTAGGSPDITFDDGSRGTYLLREFAELFGYFTPPQRQWVGLTDEEMSDTVADMDVDFGDLLWKVVCLTKIIEAKLEKKNGY